MEREQLLAASTFVVTVKSSDEFHDHVTDGIGSLEQGDTVDVTPTLSFTSYDDLMETLTPRVLELIEAIRRNEPSSINEATRVVDRDVNCLGVKPRGIRLAFSVKASSGKPGVEP